MKEQKQNLIDIFKIIFFQSNEICYIRNIWWILRLQKFFEQFTGKEISMTQ